MTIGIALLLGLIQGCTEFFPISSSAHLAFVKVLLGIDAQEKDVLFDLSCHLGTLFALLIFLRKDISHILLKDRKKIMYLFIALAPLIPFYFLLKPLREFASHPPLLGLFLILTAIILWKGNKASPKHLVHPYSLKKLLFIGTAQAIALVPGISRSASTISGARLLGWSASEAVRFSFLLSIPAICGGTFLEVLKFVPQAHTFSFPLYFSGFIASFVAGISLVSFALRFLEKGNLKPFAYYCFSVGILICLYYTTT